MTADTFARALDHVLTWEGGFIHHPRDPGGATNLGITRATLSAWRGRPASVADVRALTREEAGAIYRARYWAAVRGDLLPAGVDLCVFDWAVNAGPGRAIRTLRACAGLPVHARWTPALAARTAAADPAALIAAYGARRLAFLRGLTTWPTFGRGWRRRTQATTKAALALAAMR